MELAIIRREASGKERNHHYKNINDLHFEIIFKFFFSNNQLYILNLHLFGKFFFCHLISGNGLSTYNESENLLKYELMDGEIYFLEKMIECDYLSIYIFSCCNILNLLTCEVFFYFLINLLTR